LKVRIAERLLAEGDKVKLSVMFRGREMSHPEVGHDVLQRALGQLTEVAGVEKPPGMEGRFLSVILTPSAKKPAAATKPDKTTDGAGQAGKQEPEQASAPAAPEAQPAATGSTNES
jgi:translation initiation factor IF-3